MAKSRPPKRKRYRQPACPLGHPVGRAVRQRDVRSRLTTLRIHLLQLQDGEDCADVLAEAAWLVGLGTEVCVTVEGVGSHRTRYDGVFDRLTAEGMSVGSIPIEYRAALQKAVQSYLRARPALAMTTRLVVRTLSDTECGVWRVSRQAVEATR